MKKFLLIILCCVWTFSARAQMTDAMGMLMLQGELSRESYEGVGRMQNALNRARFQQDLASLIAEVQITFMGNYAAIDKDLLSFSGFGNMDWNIAPVSDSEYYIEFSNLDGATCFLCKGREWKTHKVEINGGGDCTGEANHVRMYF